MAALSRSPLESYLVRQADELLKEEGGAGLTTAILDLLRILEAINRLWHTLFDHIASAQTSEYNYRINSIEFINNKLTAKITRQLQDPITVVSPLSLLSLSLSHTAHSSDYFKLTSIIFTTVQRRVAKVV